MSIGELIYVLGYPALRARETDYKANISEGICRKKINDSKGQDLYYETNAIVMQGNSGGAMVNSEGELVGLISNNFAIVSKKQ